MTDRQQTNDRMLKARPVGPVATGAPHEPLAPARVLLPFPPSACSPNSRGHWSKRAKATKAYRSECWALAKRAGLVVTWEGKVHLSITFHKPSRRPMDMDNMIARMKGGFDGLADALGVDDSRFVLHVEVADEPVKSGLVEVRIGER